MASDLYLYMNELVPGSGNRASHSVVSWSWSKYDVPRSCRSLPKYVSENRKGLVAEYMSWAHNFIYSEDSLGSLYGLLSVSAPYSYAWSSLLNEGSLYKSPHIYDLLRFSALRKIIVSLGVKNLVVFGESSFQSIALDHLARVCGVTYHPRYSVSAIQLMLRDVGYKLRLLQNFITALVSLHYNFLRSSACKIACLIFSSRVALNTEVENLVVFITKFPNYDVRSMAEGKFKSNFWGEVPGIVSNMSCNLLWVFMHFNTRGGGLLSTYKAIKKLNNNRSNQNQFIGLSQLLGFSLYAKVFREYVHIVLRYPKVKKLIRNRLISGYDLLFYHYLRGDILSSTIGKNLINNIVDFHCFKRLFASLPRARYCLYMHEGQGWERAAVYHWKRYHDGPIVGVTTSTIRPMDLRYAGMATKYLHESKSLPDRITYTGDDHLHALNDLLYPEDRLCLVEAQRFAYLATFRPNLKSYIKNQHLSILVILGENLLSIRLILASITSFVRAYKDSRIVLQIKKHPLTNLSDASIKGMLGSIQYEFISGAIDKLNFANVDFSILDSSVSTAVEFLYLRIPFCIFVSESMPNMSSLLRYTDLFVYSSQEIQAAFEAGLSVGSFVSSDRSTDEAALLRLDPAYPKWREALFVLNG